MEEPVEPFTTGTLRFLGPCSTGTYIRLGAGKKSEIFTRACFYQYLRIIRQAIIENALYLFLCLALRPKLVILFFCFVYPPTAPPPKKKRKNETFKNHTNDFQISINKTKLALWFEF